MSLCFNLCFHQPARNCRSKLRLAKTGTSTWSVLRIIWHLGLSGFPIIFMTSSQTSAVSLVYTSQILPTFSLWKFFPKPTFLPLNKLEYPFKDKRWSLPDHFLEKPILAALFKSRTFRTDTLQTDGSRTPVWGLALIFDTKVNLFLQRTQFSWTSSLQEKTTTKTSVYLFILFLQTFTYSQTWLLLISCLFSSAPCSFVYVKLCREYSVPSIQGSTCLWN